jgi:hypothetical protein
MPDARRPSLEYRFFYVNGRVKSGSASLLELGPRTSCVWLFVRVLGSSRSGSGLRLLAAYTASGLMAGFLYGINGRDALTFVAAPIFLILAAVVATVVPARQVSRVDPLVALRTE